MNSLNNKPQIYFRVDYGGLIGRGHLSRCLALADVFKEKGFNPILIIRKRPSIANDELPFKILWLSEIPDVTSIDVGSWRVGTPESEASEMLNVIEADSIIILDHYALGFSFQKIVRSKKHKIVLFQDTFNKNFDADVLINYNVGTEKDYKNIINSYSTKFLIGPRYAPLNLNYAKEHMLRFNVETKVEIVGVYLGGIEAKYLERVARAIVKIDYFTDKKLEWVVNSNNEKNILSKILNESKTEIHVRLPSLINLYKRVQLFIGACGVSFLERACVGILQFNFLVADNQKNIADSIVRNQLGIVLGDLRNTKEDEILLNFQEALRFSPHESFLQVNNIFSMVDGLGASRIVERCTEGLI